MRPHLNLKQRTAKLIRSALFQPKTSASSAQRNASIKHCDVSVSLESAGARGWTMHTVIDQLCGCPYQLNGARERKSSWNGGSSWIKTLYYNIFIQELLPPRPTQFFGVCTQCGMHAMNAPHLRCGMNATHKHCEWMPPSLNYSMTAAFTRNEAHENVVCLLP